MSFIINNERNYIVYCHSFPNGKKYFGITCQGWKKRWGKGGIGYKKQLVYYAIKKYGWYNTTHYILFKNLTENEAKQKEIDLIAKYNTTDKRYGYNVDKGGGDAPTLYGVNNHRSVKVVCINTGEVFDCINDACKKYNIDKRGIQKCINNESKTSGIDHNTNERLVWQSYNEYLINPKQIKTKEYGLKGAGKRVLCVETNVIYNSTVEASKMYNTDPKYIRRVCSGKRKTYKGCHWCYIDE